MNTGKRQNWLLVPGSDRARLRDVGHGIDVAIQDLDQRIPPELTRKARFLTPEVAAFWREHGVEPAVRVRALANGGTDDVRSAVASGVRIIVLNCTDAPNVTALDRELCYWEGAHRLPFGSTEICLMVNAERNWGMLAAATRSSTRVSTFINNSHPRNTKLKITPQQSQFRDECRSLGVQCVDVSYSTGTAKVDE